MSSTPTPAPTPAPQPSTPVTPAPAKKPAPKPTPKPPTPPVLLSPALAHVAIWNRSTVLSDAQVQAAVPSFQTAVSRDFAPAWKTDAMLAFVPKAGTPDPASWIIQILDDSTQRGMLGYHSVSATNVPDGFVYARTDQQYGLNWTVTLTHELFELLLDPYAVACIFDQSSDTAGRILPYEACDACESDEWAYDINGTKISDFILPAWLDSSLSAGSAKFDFCGRLTAPLSVGHNGYLSVCTVTASSGWTQVNGQGVIGKSADYAEDPRHRR